MKGVSVLTAHEILEQWLRYSKYDPEQTKFNLLSNDWHFHSCNEKLEKIMEYDPSGTLAVMHARSVFEKTIRDTGVKVINLLNGTASIAEEQKMWALFNSEEVAAVEDQILNTMNAIVCKVIDRKMLGERDIQAERNALANSADAIVNQLSKCNVDLFLRGGPIQSVLHNASTCIHVFDTLAECLLTLETENDGIYICYVDNNGSADGYFGFYIKSNGTLLSINERVDESYPGQHKNSRNGRWSEAKAYDLFPYNHIFEYSGHDYKGYATVHSIDKEQLEFFKLKPGAYLPLVLAMILLDNKYAGTDVSDMPLKYVDSLLKVNLEMPATGMTALAVPDNSALAAVNRGFDLQMTTDDILSGAFARKRNSEKRRHYQEYGDFPDEQYILVSLYGDGFKVDVETLLEANKHLKALPASRDKLGHEDDVTPNTEFIGTEGRMEVIAYMNGRRQLAEYIRDKMYEEYKRFGGRDAVEQWFKKTVMENRDLVYSLCAEKYNAIQTGKEANVTQAGWRDASGDVLSFIAMHENCTGAWPVNSMSRCYHHYLNAPQGVDASGRENGKFLCPFTGNTASIYFTFRFDNWKQLEQVVGEGSLPKIVTGWKHDRHSFGNPILRPTDRVTEVGTPFEHDEYMRNSRYWTEQRWRDYYWHNKQYDAEPQKKQYEAKSSVFSFDITVGFSKRGLKKLLAEYGKETTEKKTS